MKKNILKILIITIIVNCSYISFAKGNIPVYTDVNLIMDSANTYLSNEVGVKNYFSFKSIGNKKINNDMVLGKWWGDMTISKNPVYLFIYGQPFGEQKEVKGGLRHRYLGYTMMDEEFPNMFFPDDKELPTKYDERNWIEEPWKSDLIESASKQKLKSLCYKDRRFDKNEIEKLGKPSDYYRKSIIYGMGICYGLCIDPSVLETRDISEIIKNIEETSKYPTYTKLKGNFLNIPWENYVHIIQPPTDFSWGIGRVWRQEGSYCNYLTIPLAPFIFCDNAPTASIWAPETAKVGEPILITAQGTDSDNGKMTHYFAVSPEDGITGFIPDKNAEKQTVESQTFYNAGNIDLEQPGLTMLSGTVTALKPGTYTFKYRVVDENGGYAIAEATTQVTEYNYDFETTKIQYDTYAAGRNVNTVVTVKNNSGKAAENVPVSVSIINKGKSIFSDSRAISMQANSSYDIYFPFITPDENTTLTITANINYSNAFPETNKSNNKKSINATIQKDFVPFGCTTSRDWTEEHFSHYKSVQDGVDAEGNPVYKNISIYGDYRYTAELKGAAWLYYVADPGVTSIKSGYGFRIEVETDVNVTKQGHTKPIGRIGEVKKATKATVYFLGKSYPMEISSSNGNKINFYLPKDTSSVTLARKIYVPVNTPDGFYDVTVVVEGASSPGGELCRTIRKQIEVKGSMYEDDYTRSAE